MFLELLQKRRSIRSFTGQPVELEKVEQLVEAALRSPSSRSLDPWEFVVVTEPQLLASLAKAKPHGASFLKGAPLAVVVCGDPAKCDVWIEDCSIATLNLHLAAADLGLGSCWIQIRLRDHNREQSAEQYVRSLLRIPDHLQVEAIVAVGYPAESRKGHDKAGLKYDRVSYNGYGKR